LVGLEKRHAFVETLYANAAIITIPIETQAHLSFSAVKEKEQRTMGYSCRDASLMLVGCVGDNREMTTK